MSTEYTFRFRLVGFRSVSLVARDYPEAQHAAHRTMNKLLENAGIDAEIAVDMLEYHGVEESGKDLSESEAFSPKLCHVHGGTDANEIINGLYGVICPKCNKKPEPTEEEK